MFILLGMYSSVWRFMSARDAIRIPIAVFLSEGIAVLFLALSQARSFETYSRSVFVIDAILCTLLIGASRLGERAIAPLIGELARPEERRRTLIVGAGRGGRSLLRELRETPGQQVIGFIDDDPRLRHRRVHGVQILGSVAEIDAVLGQRQPDAVLVTIPDAPRERLDFVVSGCERAGVDMLVRPPPDRPRPRGRPRARLGVSRRLSRLALAGIFVALAALYVVEALLHHSPWIFFDELDYSTTARRIADLGTPPGGKPYYFNGLYPFLIAPAWLADDVHTAYWVSKVIGALVMTAAVFPAYWLARMLAASRPIALFTATVTAAVPALSYSSSLMTETLAYPYRRPLLCADRPGTHRQVERLGRRDGGGVRPRTGRPQGAGGHPGRRRGRRPRLLRDSVAGPVVAALGGRGRRNRRRRSPFSRGR